MSAADESAVYTSSKSVLNNSKMGRHVRSPSHLPSLRRSDLLPNSSFTSLLPSASRSISQTHPHHDHFHHAHTITMSLHFRAILYTTDPQPQHLPSLISELQHELLKPELVTAPEQKDLRRRTCETLATSLHIPPFDRIQLLLMAANCHPPTSLRARRVRVEFARFWVEVLKVRAHSSLVRCEVVVILTDITPAGGPLPPRPRSER